MANDTAVAARKVAEETKARFLDPLHGAIHLEKLFEAKAHNLFTGIKFALGAIHVVDPDRSL